MNKQVYMDYQATTPTDPLVVESMLPYFTEKFGNPSSKQHRFGWMVESAVENARSKIAKNLKVDSKEIIFTSGATESNNLAIKGVAQEYGNRGKHIITCATEHKSVLNVCKNLEKTGFKVTYLPVDETGIIDLNLLENSISNETILVTIMVANNEIGTIQDIETIGSICAKHDVIFHTDATQAIGKIDIDICKAYIDLLSLSGHKMYGPKGIGAILVRNHKKRFKLVPQIDGGGQERGLRSGTLNVPAIIGLSTAMELSYKSLYEESIRILKLRDRMLTAFYDMLDEVYLNGHRTKRLPHNLNISFLYTEDTALMMSIKEIAVSSGAACSGELPQPSHVLKALGLTEERRHSAIRFSLGRYTTDEEVDYVIERVVSAVKSIRQNVPVYKKYLNNKSMIDKF